MKVLVRVLKYKNLIHEAQEMHNSPNSAGEAFNFMLNFVFIFNILE